MYVCSRPGILVVCLMKARKMSCLVFQGTSRAEPETEVTGSAFSSVRGHVMRCSLSLISHVMDLRSTTRLCIHFPAEKTPCPLLWNTLLSYSHSYVLMFMSPLSRVAFLPWILCASWKPEYRRGYPRHILLLIGRSPLLERLSQTSHS
jgi:hypothetical protein